MFDFFKQKSFFDLGFLIFFVKKGLYMRCGGFLVKVEDGCWMVMLVGCFGDYLEVDFIVIWKYVFMFYNMRFSDFLFFVEFVGWFY